ncbi:Glucagon receptor, partial [Ophiophagus hannah]
MVSFKVLYTVGYSLSLLALILALLILTVFRRLRCTRNYIHANLFASFGLRAISVIVKDALLEKMWGRETFQMSDWEDLLSHEAIYLYKLLIGAVFSEKNYYTLCWGVNENMAYWWIIRIPILLASMINLLIFMQILKVILAKLRASQKDYTDYKLRLAKATLTLIPLFGIHEVIFIFATDEQTTGVLRYVKVFFTLFLNSFQ